MDVTMLTAYTAHDYNFWLIQKAFDHLEWLSSRSPMLSFKMVGVEQRLVHLDNLIALQLQGVYASLQLFYQQHLIQSGF